MRINVQKIETILARDCLTRTEVSKRSGISRQSVSCILQRGTCSTVARKGLARTGVMEYIKQEAKTDPEKYLAVYHMVPQLEQLSKANLPQMVTECLRNFRPYVELFRTSKETSLVKGLGIDAQGMKRLRALSGGIKFVKWLQREKETGRRIPDDVILWYCQEGITWEDISFMTDRMDAVQICRYIQHNMREYRMGSHRVLVTWKDYLSMAQKFHYNVADAYIYRTKKLRQKHNELAARCDTNIGAQVERIRQEFPGLAKVIESLAQKYAYRGQEYIISAPASVEDIILEGRCLNHCIANSDRYWERMERQESYLLFLRKAREPKDSYYTLEIEPNGTIRQIRSFEDEQYADLEAARAFLKEWQSVVAQRLTAEDRQKAKESEVLRLQEFAQMRKDRIVIHTGRLAGKLLIDVLTSDLMENTAA